MGTPIYIDTHAHLYDEAFSEDREECIRRAMAAGVTRFILPGIDASTQDDLERMAEAYPGICFPCIGLHPTSVQENWKKELDQIEQRLGERPYHALGEIGLDGYWSKAFIKEQQTVFYQQLRWAQEAGLPVIIHLREATDVLFEVLDRFRKEDRPLPRGVFHAFSGSYETYARIRQYGPFLFGIGGVVTYKKASIAATVEQLPLSEILLETDAPYLTPVPHRGKRNESAYIPYIAARIAELQHCPVEEVAAQTTHQAEQLFNLPE